MGRSPSNFRQQDVQRAIKAAKNAGLDIVRVEVEGRRISLIVLEDGKPAAVSVNAWDGASTKWATPRRK